MELKATSLVKNILLYPLSLLWESTHYIRRICYDYGIIKQKSFVVPIISIGNLTFGGTGKTPFTLWLAEYLQSQNKRPMVLMRGYKGRLENSSGVIYSGNDQNPDAIDFGDEALLFARRLKDAAIVVGKNRSENLSFYFPKILPDVVLLDDGHQHLKIKRKLNIVLFDALMPLERYQVAPLGYMREGFHSMKDADLVVFGRADLVDREKLESLKELIVPHLPIDTPIAEVGFRPSGFFSASYNKVYDLDEIRDRKVICLAGVASPKSFFKLLEELGADILLTETFPDHHFFKLEEIQTLLDFAKRENALIVTTEKDIVRISKVTTDDSIVFLEVDIRFLHGELETKSVIDSSFEQFKYRKWL